jgi:hypothetical protein
MQSAEERRRLMSRLGSASITPLGAVLKCAAGILVLVIIAAGPWAFMTAGGPATAAGERPSPRADRAVAESKRVFDERRQRYIEAHPDSHLVREGGAAGQWQTDSQSDPGFQTAVIQP